MNKLSFVSASVLPVKLLTNIDLVSAALSNKIIPWHVQLNPTNRCPLRCSFCSCENRDKMLELDFERAKDIISQFKKLGTKAITITGGGDPLAYSHINELIEFIHDLQINISLVTNGVLFKNLKIENVNKITWCRISISDEHIIDGDKLTDYLSIPIDWAFSYVLCNKKLNEDNIRSAIKIATKYNFTHIRIVNDILDKSINIEDVKILVDRLGLLKDKIIYQGRKEYTKGNKKCLISLLKPNIGADGNIYPCCGVQYAKTNPDLNYSSDFSMGTDILDIYNNQKYFDGSICSKCYYSEYNDVLSMMWNACDLMHANFI